MYGSLPPRVRFRESKFQYSLVEKKGTADKFAGCLQWIEDAGIITRCYNLHTTELPLEGNADKSVFKVYMNDIGLFVSTLEQGTQGDILRENLLGYKGAIFENLAASILYKMKRKHVNRAIKFGNYNVDGLGSITFFLHWRAKLKIPIQRAL